MRRTRSMSLGSSLQRRHVSGSSGESQGSSLQRRDGNDSSVLDMDHEFEVNAEVAEVGGQIFKKVRLKGKSENGLIEVIKSKGIFIGYFDDRRRAIMQEPIHLPNGNWEVSVPVVQSQVAAALEGPPILQVRFNRKYDAQQFLQNAKSLAD